MFFSKSFIVSGLTFRSLLHFGFIFMYSVRMEKAMAPHSVGLSCLENPTDGGAWWAAVYGVAQNWTRLKRLSSSSSSSSVVLESVLIHSFTHSCPVFPTSLVEKTVFFALYILASFVKDKVPKLCEFISSSVCVLFDFFH